MSQGTELAKAYVQIIPSAQGISGSISNVLNGEASSAGDSAGQKIGSGLVSKIKGIVAAAGIGVAIKKSLSEGADLQQSLGGIETLFKDSADKVIASAKNAYKTAGMSANEYMETVTSFSASLLQGLSGDTNKAAEVADMALVDMSDNANKMGTSMELIQNAYQGFAKQNYTMLDNLKLGYGGTKTEMERLLADAQKISGVKYDISNLSDVYSAIHVIQEEMGITGTTAKEASETFSGSLASMKAAASNLLGNLSLGEDIRPSLSALADTVHTFLANNLVPMLGNIIKALPQMFIQTRNHIINELIKIGEHSDEIIQSGIALVKDFAIAIVSSIPYLGEAAFKLISSFGSTIINTDWLAVATDVISGLKDCLDLAAGEIFGSDENILVAFIESIKTGLPKLLEQGVSFISSIAEGIASEIPSLLETGGKIVEQVYTCIMESAPMIWESGTELLLNVVNGIKDNLPTIVETAVSVVDNLLTTICENAPQMLEAGIEVLQQLLQGLIDALPDILLAAVDLVVKLGTTIAQHAPKLIESGITLLGKLAAGLISAIPDLLAKIPSLIKQIKEKFTSVDWGEIGLNVIKGIAKGLTNALSEIGKAAKKVANSLMDSLKEKLGIHSPSIQAEKIIGKNVDLGVARGVRKNVSPVVDSMRDMGREMLGTLDTEFLLTTNAIKGPEYNITRGSFTNEGYPDNTQNQNEVIQSIVGVLVDQGILQVNAIKEGIASIRMVPNEREFIRFMDKLGYVRG